MADLTPEEQALLDSQNALVAEVRRANDRADEGLKSQAAVTTMVENMRADFTALTERMDSVETRANRLPAANMDGNEAPMDVRAFASFLRRDRAGMEPEMLRYLATDEFQTGGAIAFPPTVKQTIMEYVREIDPMRAICTVERIQGTAFEVPAETSDDFGAGWVAERGTRSETDTGKFSLIRIPTNSMYAEPKMTNQMVAMTPYDIVGYVTRKVAARKARLEGAAFITGDGNGKPTGLASGGYSNVQTGAATTIPDGDCFRRVTFALLEPFLPGAQWVMRRATLLDVALLKDGVDRYIYAPSMAAEKPDMLCGYPMRFAPTVPAVAASAKIAYFGNFAEAYTIVDNDFLTIVRDQVTAKGWTIFFTESQVGGAPVNTQALITLTVGV